ncbi:12258_t:CDS:2, partial [Cetraspora pellucida]
MIELAKYLILASIILIYNYLIDKLTKHHNNPNYSHEIIIASKDFINGIKATILQIYKNNYESSSYEATNYDQDNIDNDNDLLLDYIYKKKQKINQQNEVELYLEASWAMRKQDILQYIPVERIFSERTDLISVKRCGLSADSIRA